MLLISPTISALFHQRRGRFTHHEVFMIGLHAYFRSKPYSGERYYLEWRLV